MKKELLTLFCVAGISFPALGGTYNIAPKARATASSSLNADGDALESQRRLHPPRQCGRMGIGSADALLAAITLPLDPARLGRGGHPLAHRPLRPADGRCAYGRRRPLFQRRYTYRSSRDPGQRGAQGRGIRAQTGQMGEIRGQRRRGFPCRALRDRGIPARRGRRRFRLAGRPVHRNDQGALFLLHHGQPAGSA